MRPKKFLNLAETRIPRIHTNGRLSGVAPAVGPIPLIPVDDLSSRGKDSKAGRESVTPLWTVFHLCNYFWRYFANFGIFENFAAKKPKLGDRFNPTVQTLLVSCVRFRYFWGCGIETN